MKDRILKDIVTSMKEKDKERLSVLRMVKGAIQLEEINKKETLKDEDVIGVLAKQIKTRKESIVEFEKGNRQDLIDQTNREIAILEEYMPEQLSMEEVEAIVKEVIEAEGATSMKDMGKVMKAAKEKIGAASDGRTINEAVKKMLG